MSTDRVTPATPGDDPPERPCACEDGWVFVGFMVEGDDGDEVEVVEALRCRRCEAKPGRENDGR